MNPSRLEALRASLTPTSPKKVEPQPKAAPVEPWSRVLGYAAVDARSGGRCEHPSGCTQPADVHHHIAGRGEPDPHNPSNLLHFCNPHHLWTHAHPAESYELGTMRKRVR